MNLQQIKTAVDAGRTVHWSNTGYIVIKDKCGKYHIKYLPNGCTTELHGQARTKFENVLNGRPDDFFIAEEVSPVLDRCAGCARYKDKWCKGVCSDNDDCRWDWIY